MSNQNTINMYIDRIGKETRDEMGLAEKSLVGIGEDAVQPVIDKMLSNEDLLKRTISVRILKTIGGQKAIDALVQRFETEEHRDIARDMNTALHELGHFDQPDWGQLESQNKFDVSHAIYIIEQYPESHKRIKTLVDHSNPMVRAEVMLTLVTSSFINDPDVPSLLEKGLNDSDPNVQTSAKMAQKLFNRKKK